MYAYTFEVYTRISPLSWRTFQEKNGKRKIYLSTEKTEQLIELVRGNESLYNTSQPDYRDQVKSSNIWESISKALDVDSMDGKHVYLTS